MIKPVLAIDCDGIVCDNAVTWDEYFSEGHCGTPHVMDYDPTDWDRYPKICEVCWYEVLHNPELLHRVKPRPEAAFYLGSLANFYTLYLVTNRPSSTFNTTSDWVVENRLHRYFREVIYSKDKRATCFDIGARALLDDYGGNLEPLIGSGVHPIVWDYPYNRHLTDMTRVFDWETAVQAIFKTVATGLVST